MTEVFHLRRAFHICNKIFFIGWEAKKRVEDPRTDAFGFSFLDFPVVH